MLILTRHVGQVLNIGDDTEVCVLGVTGNQVRLGINAPKDTPVHREEIYQRIQQQAGQAPGSGSAHEKGSIDETRTYSGCVANLMKARGFGFIYVPGLPDNVFFHATDVDGDRFARLEEGMEVHCQVKQGPRGPVAHTVALEPSSC